MDLPISPKNCLVPFLLSLTIGLEYISKYELGLLQELVQSNIKAHIRTPQELDYVLYVLKRVIFNVYYIQHCQKGARRYRCWRGNQKFVSQLASVAFERNVMKVKLILLYELTSKLQVLCCLLFVLLINFQRKLKISW